jgi:hypothetical protein
MWTYATVGMSIRPEAGKDHGLEFHLFAPDASEAHVELLTVIAHFHLTGDPLGWGHTVSFGRPWHPASRCSYGLTSLPYLDGPHLEWLGATGSSTRFLWLVPITREESGLVISDGVAALEERLEKASFDYLNPERPSVV